MDNCDPGLLEHGHQVHWSVVDSGKLWQDEHLIVARLRTAADDNDLLDDKSPFASFDFHQRIQMAHSFSS